MAFFKRQTLKDKGLTDEQIEYILAESNRALAADYAPKTEIQAQIEKAVEDAKKAVPAPNVKESEDYKKLEADFAAYKAKESARNSDDFKGVKAKFFDEVYGKVDTSKPIPEQITKIKADFEEYFEPEQKQEQGKPSFGAPTSGSMPKGNEGNKTFAQLWGHEKERN